MSKFKYCQYYVEGKCEESLIHALKTKLRVLVPGKVQVLNVINTKISKAQLIMLKQGTAVVFVFDTDVNNINYLIDNINLINSCKQVTSLILVPQVDNFEDELVRCTDIHNAIEFTHSTGINNFKHDFIHINNLSEKLIQRGFDISKLWIMTAKGIFTQFTNGSAAIKI